jgi:WD40 repeat protein
MGSICLSGSGGPNQCHVWSSMTCPSLSVLSVLPNLTAGRDILASSPDGQLIAALLWDCIVIVADCTGNLQHTIDIRIHTDEDTKCGAVSLNKECLATFNNDGIQLFDLKTGELRRSLKTGRYNWSHIIAISPDGQLLPLYVAKKSSSGTSMPREGLGSCAQEKLPIGPVNWSSLPMAHD